MALRLTLKSRKEVSSQLAAIDEQQFASDMELFPELFHDDDDGSDDYGDSANGPGKDKMSAGFSNTIAVKSIETWWKGREIVEKMQNLDPLRTKFGFRSYRSIEMINVSWSHLPTSSFPCFCSM